MTDNNEVIGGVWKKQYRQYKVEVIHLLRAGANAKD